MKRNVKFIAAISLLFVLLFALQYRMPRSFSWEETYDTNDKQPLGAYVFDSVMQDILPHRYRVMQDTSVYMLYRNGFSDNLLITGTDMSYDSLTQIAIKEIARRGVHVVVAAKPEYYNYEYYGLAPDKPILDFVPEGEDYFAFKALKARISHSDNKEVLTWRAGVCKQYGESKYELYNNLFNTYIRKVGKHEAGIDTIAVLEYRSFDEKRDSIMDGKVIIASQQIGKGRYTVVASPVLFTNYGILNGQTTEYVHRVMTLIANKPVTRIWSGDAEEVLYASEQSPLDFFLRQAPLRSALYLSLFGIVIFVIFTARRKQRIIPLMPAPTNRSLEFVRTIGSLYFSKHDNVGLLRKKYKFFAEHIRYTLLIDITDTSADESNYEMLANNTGKSHDEIKSTLNELRNVIKSKTAISNKQLHKHIDLMNSIVNEI